MDTATRQSGRQDMGQHGRSFIRRRIWPGRLHFQCGGGFLGIGGQRSGEHQPAADRRQHRQCGLGGLRRIPFGVPGGEDFRQHLGQGADALGHGGAQIGVAAGFRAQGRQGAGGLGRVAGGEER